MSDTVERLRLTCAKVIHVTFMIIACSVAIYGLARLDDMGERPGFLDVFGELGLGHSFAEDIQGDLDNFGFTRANVVLVTFKYIAKLVVVYAWLGLCGWKVNMKHFFGWLAFYGLVAHILRMYWRQRMKYYINQGPQDVAILASGVYHGRYQQNLGWQDIPNFTLHLDDVNNTCSGYGKDSVGSYTLQGLCRGKRLAVEKTYIIRTVDKRVNFGHTVWLQLEFQKLERHSTQARPSWGFVGSWEVSITSFFHKGNNSMEIWQEDTTTNCNPPAETLAPEDCAEETKDKI
uniref:Uncharacterized protein n=2 Tax=Mucochytrium quahogii TaxID=96639 RepID=A0A7S2RU11_9STRA|mmetsp:Transcript_19415/g.31959  ORF Transcript_19415/g.31959 Transcript_19415/m.31959 type:complete len:289 (-) Transcript_19415:32-898(-)